MCFFSCLSYIVEHSHFEHQKAMRFACLTYMCTLTFQDLWLVHQNPLIGYIMGAKLALVCMKLKLVETPKHVPKFTTSSLSHSPFSPFHTIGLCRSGLRRLTWWWEGCDNVEYPESVLMSETIDKESPYRFCTSLFPSTFNVFVGPRLSLSESVVALDLIDLGVSGVPCSFSDILPIRGVDICMYTCIYIYVHTHPPTHILPYCTVPASSWMTERLDRLLKLSERLE